jgi:hypothetical protein
MKKHLGVLLCIFFVGIGSTFLLDANGARLFFVHEMDFVVRLN